MRLGAFVLADANPDRDNEGMRKTLRFPEKLTVALVMAVVLFAACVALGMHAGRVRATLPLVGTALVLEAQPAAVASVALRFHPLDGALISVLGNLIPIPVLMVAFHEIVARWRWAKRLADRSVKWSERYGRFGVPVLIVLSPVVGAYVALAMGYGLGWRPRMTLLATLAGMCGSVLAICYGGHAAVTFFRRL